MSEPTVSPPAKRSAIFLQNACYQHRYIRSKDTSNIVERPERLRAVTAGLSAAIARLEQIIPHHESTPNNIAKSDSSEGQDPNDLAAALDRMNLASTPSPPAPHSSVVTIVQSSASLDILHHPAVKFIHGDIEGDVYLENLKAWTKDSRDKIANGESEIPDGYAQGDLYLCPESLNAMQGALGTVCEAVDEVVTSSRSTTPSARGSIDRAFVAVRPPGHHCGEDTPCGFCFVNNVAVGAAHAHQRHGIQRIVIFDIDLHHGNGTQSIVWQINEETYRQTLESESNNGLTKPGPQIYYGSIHDILSYPCEDGKPNLVQAASVSLHKSHGQYIENVHLQTYTSEDHFWDVLYKEQYTRVIRKAEEFLEGTGGEGDDVLVFISCGMDACEHEYSSMSRHDRKVPTSFYYRFARDVCAFADKYAKGRVVSVLEGGYSDRALMSGGMAHLTGLVDLPPHAGKVQEDWWNLDNLVKLEKATQKRRGGRPSATGGASTEPWIERTLAIFAPLDGSASVPARTAVPAPASTRTLRDRSKGNGKSASPGPSPTTNRTKPLKTQTHTQKPAPASSSNDAAASGSSPQKPAPSKDAADSGSSPPRNHPPSTGSSAEHVSEGEALAPKKLPKVILRLGKPPETT